MMVDSLSDGLLDNDRGRPRRDWVAAYRAWAPVSDDEALTGTGLSGEQRAARGCYRAAEAACLAHLRMVADSEFRA
jgi:hypothetical protein